MFFNSVHKTLAACGWVALAVTTTTLAVPQGLSSKEEIKRFTYDFNGWKNEEIKKHLRLEQPTGECSLVLQAFSGKAQESNMVFPYCPGRKPDAADVTQPGVHKFNSFIYTGSSNGDAAYKEVDGLKQIGPSIFILDDLQPAEGNACEVRAGRVKQLNLGDMNDQNIGYRDPKGAIDLEKLPGYPNPKCFDMNRYGYSRRGINE